MIYIIILCHLLHDIEIKNNNISNSKETILNSNQPYEHIIANECFFNKKYNAIHQNNYTEIIKHKDLSQKIIFDESKFCNNPIRISEWTINENELSNETNKNVKL